MRAARRPDADDRPDGRRRPIRPVRPARVLRLPVLRHARRRLLRLVRAPPALARARARGHPRPARLGRCRRPGDRRDPMESASCAPRKCRWRVARTTSAGRWTTRCLRPNCVPLPGRQRSGRTWTASSSSRSGATRSGRCGDDALLRDAWPADRPGAGARRGVRPRRRRAARARRRPRPDVRHVADARAERLRRLALAGGAPGRDRGRGAGRGRQRRAVDAAVARFESWFETGTGGVRVAALGAATTTRYDDGGGVSSDSDHGRPAGRPVVRRRDRPRRRRRPGPGRAGAADGPRDERRRVRGRRDGRGQRRSPGRLGRPIERAVGRGLGRDDLRARRVHDRPRPRRRGLADGPRRLATSRTSAACGSGRPRPTTRTATSAPRSTCGRWRSGRSRRPWRRGPRRSADAAYD